MPCGQPVRVFAPAGPLSRPHPPRKVFCRSSHDKKITGQMRPLAQKEGHFNARWHPPVGFPRQPPAREPRTRSRGACFPGRTRTREKAERPATPAEMTDRRRGWVRLNAARSENEERPKPKKRPPKKWRPKSREETPKKGSGKTEAMPHRNNMSLQRTKINPPLVKSLATKRQGRFAEAAREIGR